MSEIIQEESDLKNLTDIFTALSATEQIRVSEQFAKWYNLLLKLYSKDFGLDDTGNNVRNFESEEQVIIFFREALLWWWKRKPVIGEIMTPLDAIKTRTCLGHIHDLKRKLELTEISLSKLELNEHFGKTSPVKSESTV